MINNQSKCPVKSCLIQGNEACAKAALNAGVRFFAGYPITPSSEIMEYMAYNMPLVDGVFIQMEDEIGSIAAILGASLAGVKAMTATSGPGFSLMQENIGFAVMAEIPAVIVNVQRLGPSTGAPTRTSQGDLMQACWGSHGDYKLIALTPSSVEECYYLTLKAVSFAERFRIPVILLMEEVIGHLREAVRLPEARDVEIWERPQPNSDEKYQPFKALSTGVPPMLPFGGGEKFHVTGLYHDESGFPVAENSQEIERLQRRLRDKVTKHKNEITLFTEWNAKEAKTLIVTCGSPARSAKAALKEKGKDIKHTGLLVLQTLWPFPEHVISEYSKSAERIIVPEHNFGQLAGEIKKVVRSDMEVITINRVDGLMIEPETILAYL